ncbi:MULTISPECIES: hypothetical protein [unclassified Rhizobium]|uniref:hypothetical protein n=1 Tax=unclassified Rhizobium TaxID=2613769 RepID=UPI001615EEB1|nr:MULTISPECIES: hypothetical protein [unclassified Rhizobium]MBB3386579.1 hypothetical protein [Rhizobium sp. BK098]MBB3618283.1 hypothetical protein [Rhizobium sp. BK609]MBB3683940.1 hypothetical protein [Rhizobium sp. BK612]
MTALKGYEPGIRYPLRGVKYTLQIKQLVNSDVQKGAASGLFTSRQLTRKANMGVIGVCTPQTAQRLSFGVSTIDAPSARRRAMIWPDTTSELDRRGKPPSFGYDFESAVAEYFMSAFSIGHLEDVTGDS